MWNLIPSVDFCSNWVFNILQKQKISLKVYTLCHLLEIQLLLELMDYMSDLWQKTVEMLIKFLTKKLHSGSRQIQPIPGASKNVNEPWTFARRSEPLYRCDRKLVKGYMDGPTSPWQLLLQLILAHSMVWFDAPWLIASEPLLSK